MTMKSARHKYQATFSALINEGKDDEVKMTRIWNSKRPSFKDWARSELKAMNAAGAIRSPKLRRIVEQRRG